MPSLHLDIPSIDWVGRPLRSGKPGRGKGCPAGGERESAPKHPLAKRAAGREARDPHPWPCGNAAATV